jgi:hypothetical protein
MKIKADVILARDSSQSGQLQLELLILRASPNDSSCATMLRLSPPDFFVIARDQRLILHCNVTKHPSSAWVVQPLREAFLYDSAPGHLIFDRSTQFNEEVIDTVRNFGIKPSQTRACFKNRFGLKTGTYACGGCSVELLS